MHQIYDSCFELVATEIMISCIIKLPVQLLATDTVKFSKAYAIGHDDSKTSTNHSNEDLILVYRVARSKCLTLVFSILTVVRCVLLEV